MTTTTYAISVNGQQYTVSADWAQASSPVEFDGSGTQYQVADFRHSSRAAMERNILSDESGSAESLEELGVDLDDMVGYDDIDGESLRLADDADTSHDSAEEMYDSFGWHLTTEDAGDVPLQAVTYDNADADAGLIDLLMEENEGLTEDDARTIADKAREVREYCDGVESLLKQAVECYESDDVRGCVAALDQASSLESDGGDDPASRSLRSNLIERLETAEI